MTDEREVEEARAACEDFIKWALNIDEWPYPTKPISFHIRTILAALEARESKIRDYAKLISDADDEVQAARADERRRIGKRLRGFRVWENAWELAVTPAVLADWIEEGCPPLAQEHNVTPSDD